jgi:phosphoserine aminotransferase
LVEEIHQARTTITILFISKEIQQDFLEKANDNNFSLYVPRSIPNSIQISVNGNIPEEEVDNFCIFIDEFKM